MLEKIKRSKSAVSTMVLAAIVVLILAVAAVGAYVLTSSDEDNGNDGDDGNNGDNGNNGNTGDWPGLDFSDPMIEGTLGIGTVYTYSYNISGIYLDEITMTIIGQSGSYYAYEIMGGGELIKYGMIHKQTGQLRFSEPDGTDGEYDGEPLSKWKYNVNSSTTINKRDTTDVSVSIKKDMVFLSNSKSILPYKFYIHNSGETEGNEWSTVEEAELIGTDLKDPEGYDASENIGNMSWYSITFKENNKLTGNGNVHNRIMGDIGPDKYLAMFILETEREFDGTFLKLRHLRYGVASDDPSISSPYDIQGNDAKIYTKWGEKDCEYYYYEYTGFDIEGDQYTAECGSYVGKDDGISYLMTEIHTYSYRVEYAEYFLEKYGKD